MSVYLKQLMASLAVLSLWTAVEAAPLEYAASVQQAYAAKRPLRSVALVPFACPPEIDCAELEKNLAEHLTEQTGLKVTPSKTLTDLMARAGIHDLNEHESRLIIAEGLSVDAFAYVRVPKAQVDKVPPREDDKWKDVKRIVVVKTASLEFRVATPDDTSLVQVSGNAEVPDAIRSLESISTHLFEVMLEKAWHPK